MISPGATPQEVHYTILLEKLAQGWAAEHKGWPEELMQRFASRLDARVEVAGASDNALQYVSNIDDIYLRGMGNVPCLILGGGDKAALPARQFSQKAFAPGNLPFVFALSDCTREIAREVFPRDRCLVLTEEHVKQLLTSQTPKLQMKRFLLQQISRRRLAPYNLLLPAEGVMFFGRQNELGRLIDEDTTSFAIAGPGRIGKTSLLNRYRKEMVRRRDRSHCRFPISFFDCKDTTANGIARFVAMAIANSSKSAKMTPDGLLKFLSYYSKALGGPLDLLLDEVDLVCESEAFKALGAAARLGYCRLVLCGKEVLLRASLSDKSLLGCRLDLMQLEPLDQKSATDLILKPLEDLGFEISEQEQLVNRVLRLTGRLPYLLQFYGQKLVELAIEENADTVSLEHINTLKWDFVTAQYFVKPLIDLEDPETRLMGLLILRDGWTEFSIPDAIEAGLRAGITINHARAVEICNNLVINNVLAWRGGSYRIANEGLCHYAREMGYLSNALEESAQLVKKRSSDLQRESLSK